MKFKKLFTIGWMVCLACHGSMGQFSIVFPEIGKKLPDVTFTIQHAPIKTQTISGMKGKPVLLYFFSKGCIASFKALPYINDLYRQYNTLIQFVGVAVDYNDGIKDTYHEYQKVYDLQMPVAFDSTVYKSFGLRAYPTLYLLDAEGIIRAITSGIAPEALDAFLKGEPFKFIDTSRAAKEASHNRVNPQMPLFVNGNGGTETEFLQRSVISEWKPGMGNSTLPTVYKHQDPFIDLKFIQVVGRELGDLYRIAYLGRGATWSPNDTVAYGKYHFGLILETKDSSRFNANWKTGENLYCYSQVMPPEKRSKQYMMRMMQDDLKNCFGYEVAVEVRKMPYLKLVATQDAADKLRVNPAMRGKTNADMVMGGDFYSLAIEVLIEMIHYPGELGYRDLPLLNETGIEGEIDISLKAVMTNLNEVRRALKKSGLDIIRDEKDMHVIVIRDPQPLLK